MEPKPVDLIFFSSDLHDVAGVAILPWSRLDRAPHRPRAGRGAEFRRTLPSCRDGVIVFERK